MSIDASVGALMDHMNDVDKRRRLTIMLQKEVETKLSHASREQADLERQRTAMTEEEGQLQKDLDTLAGQQKQVQLQLLMETDRLRRCNAEEPLLQAHAEEQLVALEAEKSAWKANLAELEELAKAWQDDPCMRAVRQSLAAVDKETRELKAAHDTLEKETAELRMKASQMREALEAAAAASSFEANSSQALSGGVSDAARDPSAAAVFSVAAVAAAVGDADLAAIRDQLDREEEEWRQWEANTARQTAAVQREVDDITARTQELQGMLTDVQETTSSLLTNAKQLAVCVSSNRCKGCLLVSNA